MVEDAADPVLERKAQEQAARLAEDAAELLTAETDRRRIDDRHHLFDVPGQQRVEQGFVGVLQAAKENVFLQVRAEAAKGVEPASDLQIEGGHVGRQQAVQIERIALGIGERRAFVQQRIVEQLIAAERGLDHSRHLCSPRAVRPLLRGYQPDEASGAAAPPVPASRGRALPNTTPFASLPSAVRMTMATATVPATTARAKA